MLSSEGNFFSMVMPNEFTLGSWVYFLKKREDTHKKFKEFLADCRDHGEVEVVPSNKGSESTWGRFVEI